MADSDSSRWLLNLHGRCLVTCALLLLAAVSSEQLSENIYDAKCPQAMSTIKQKVDKFVNADRSVAASLMRLHFHDCFVRGCDGSVLLNSTESMLTEKEALLNKGSIRGFEQIDEIKYELEHACPGVVSCADILAVVARDATVKLGGWSWPVFLGRFDGVVSFADEVNGSLPTRLDSYAKLVATFAKVGLDAKDMVILSGGHSIGKVHCGAFFERLYNFQGLNITDPSIDPSFAAFLKKQCPQTNPLGFTALDTTNGTFDSAYYHDLLTNRGILQSDVALLSDPLGVEYAIKAVSDPQSFLFEFGQAMIKMGNAPGPAPYGWRKHCAFVEHKPR
ncbi:hypothetical protein R1flu_013897 [Riccia fluitans]|uniref:Peroxidase n=1 Tax=Riccia fluitans TaxID=41844 RepID=A0ABD1YEW1_9MARC